MRSVPTARPSGLELDENAQADTSHCGQLRLSQPLLESGRADACAEFSGRHGSSRSGTSPLRFLAEDVAKDLDTVLDVVLRSLAHRRR